MIAIPTLKKIRELFIPSYPSDYSYILEIIGIGYNKI